MNYGLQWDKLETRINNLQDLIDILNDEVYMLSKL